MAGGKDFPINYHNHYWEIGFLFISISNIRYILHSTNRSISGYLDMHPYCFYNISGWHKNIRFPFKITISTRISVRTTIISIWHPTGILNVKQISGSFCNHLTKKRTFSNKCSCHCEIVCLEWMVRRAAIRWQYQPRLLKVGVTFGVIYCGANLVKSKYRIWGARRPWAH